MVKSGLLDWKWPESEDLMWFDKDDLVKRIQPPIQKSGRGAFSVPDMRGYSSIFYKM